MKKTINGVCYDTNTAITLYSHITDSFSEILSMNLDQGIQFFLWSGGEGYDPETGEGYEEHNARYECIIIPLTWEEMQIWLAMRGKSYNKKVYLETLETVKNNVAEYGADQYEDEPFINVYDNGKKYAFFSF